MIFFTASESIFEVYLKYTNKRAINNKFTWLFLTASESIFEVYLKYLNKRARNNKFTWLFLTASESIFEVYLKCTKIGNNVDVDPTFKCHAERSRSIYFNAVWDPSRSFRMTSLRRKWVAGQLLYYCLKIYDFIYNLNVFFKKRGRPLGRPAPQLN